MRVAAMRVLRIAAFSRAVSSSGRGETKRRVIVGIKSETTDSALTIGRFGLQKRSRRADRRKA